MSKDKLSKFNISFNASVSLEEIITSLVWSKEHSQEDLFTFIKELDEGVGKWNFTLKLINHFKQLELLFKKEQVDLDAAWKEK